MDRYFVIQKLLYYTLRSTEFARNQLCLPQMDLSKNNVERYVTCSSKLVCSFANFYSKSLVPKIVVESNTMSDHPCTSDNTDHRRNAASQLIFAGSTRHIVDKHAVDLTLYSLARGGRDYCA